MKSGFHYTKMEQKESIKPLKVVFKYISPHIWPKISVGRGYCFGRSHTLEAKHFWSQYFPITVNNPKRQGRISRLPRGCLEATGPLRQATGPPRSGAGVSEILYVDGFILWFMVLWVYGFIVLWFYGVMVFLVLWFYGFYGFMVLWCHSCMLYSFMVLWFYVFMLLWFYGFMVVWFHGFIVVLFYGFLVLWFHGFMVLLFFFRFMVLLFYVFMALWFYSCMVLWFYGFMFSKVYQVSISCFLIDIHLKAKISKIV